MSGNPETDDCLAFYKPCGCLDGVYVLTGSEAGAYKAAAEAAKRGCKVEQMSVLAWKAGAGRAGWYCADHQPEAKTMPMFGEADA